MSDDMWRSWTLPGVTVPLKKYHQGWTHRASENSKDWKKYWIVLRGFMLFVFESESTYRESMCGTLTLNQETECRSLPGDTKKKGYKMELVTVCADGGHLRSKFKFASQNERDLWKSFVVGISQGMIPNDVQLHPLQLKNVHKAVAEVWITPPSLPNIPRPSTLLPCPKVSQNYVNNELGVSSYSPQPSVCSSGSNESSDHDSFQSLETSPNNSRTEDVTNLRQLMERQSKLAIKDLKTVGVSFRNDIEVHRRFSADYRPPPPPPTTHNISELTTRRKSIYALGPEFSTTAQVVADSSAFALPKHGHLFYANDRDRDSPSWFFEECLKDQAEGVLTVGRKYGNVLMRPSYTGGKYFISTLKEVSGGTQLKHYSIAVTSSGFKIDIDDKHEPMRCLSDVMDFFVSVAGPGTRPMTCNDIAKSYGKEDQNRSMVTIGVPPLPLPPSAQHYHGTPTHYMGLAQHYHGNPTDDINSGNLPDYLNYGGRNAADRYGGCMYQEAHEDQLTLHLKPDGWDTSSPTRVSHGYLSINGVSTEDFQHNATPNQPAPVKNVAFETLMRNQSYQMGSRMPGFNSTSTQLMSQTANVPTPPFPPLIETISSSIPRPPAPPYTHSPPVFNPAPSPQHPTPTFQSPVSPVCNTAPQRNEGNHSIEGSAALRFQQELAAHLKPKPGQKYAGTTILTFNNYFS